MTFEAKTLDLALHRTAFGAFADDRQREVVALSTGSSDYVDEEPVVLAGFDPPYSHRIARWILGSGRFRYCNELGHGYRGDLGHPGVTRQHS